MILARRMALSGYKKDGRELRIFENVDELSCNFAEYIAELSEVSIKERGVFAIALSGGSLVKLMGYVSVYICTVLFLTLCGVNLTFYHHGVSRKLCEAPYNKTVDWAKWYIFWVDERVVAKSHADSNYKLVKDGFLSKVDSPLLYIY